MPFLLKKIDRNYDYLYLSFFNIVLKMDKVNLSLQGRQLDSIFVNDKIWVFIFFSYREFVSVIVNLSASQYLKTFLMQWMFDITEYYL